MTQDRRKRGDDLSTIEGRIASQNEREIESAEVRDALGRLMRGSPDFRLAMRAIIARGGMFHSVMTGNSQTFYLSGRQDFAREIWAQLAQADAGRAIEMLKPMEKHDG